MTANHSEGLEEQVRALREQVRRMEDALVRQGVLSREFIEQPRAECASVLPMGASPLPPPTVLEQKTTSDDNYPIAPPNFGYAATGAADDERSLESRIGSQWFNRIGIAAVLISMAWFLKLAMDNHWIGPLGRVLIGLVAGVALIAWSERFRGRGFAIFSYSLKAVGSGTLYLALWAAFSLYQLIPAGAAFAAMIAVTAFNGYMAWAQDAELLGLYAIAGALSTPLLVSTGENHEITLFSYLLLLNLAVLVLVSLRPWSRLLFGAFAGTVVFFFGWWMDFYTVAQFGRTTFFLTVFFLLFAFAPRLVQFELEDGVPRSGWDSLALVVLPAANAVLGFLAYYLLLDRFQSDWAKAFLAVGFAAFYLLLLRLPARGRLRESPPLLSALHLAAAVVFLTIAIPLKAQGRWLTIGWLAEGAALVWIASRVHLQLLKILALLCLALGVGALLVVNPPASTTPIFNQRFGSYLAGIAALAFSAWVAMKARGDEDSTAAANWKTIAAGAMLGMNALILVAISLEIHSYWWLRRWTGDANQWEAHRMGAQFTYSLWFMIFGAALLATGFWRRSAFLRWQGLVLLAVTIVKVFLFDMSELGQGYRILSFLGLGALLFAVSFVYQRDWLKLRAGKGESDEA